jgi:hypothetical protein
MNAFENLGYAASNELAPDAWKDYMLGNLDKQDQYQQERLNQYVALQERARAKRKNQKKANQTESDSWDKVGIGKRGADSRAIRGGG